MYPSASKEKPLHIHEVCSILCIGSGFNSPVYLHRTKRNLKSFHYLKRTIIQLKRMFLLTAIVVGSLLCALVIAALSHSLSRPHLWGRGAELLSLTHPGSRPQLQHQTSGLTKGVVFIAGYWWCFFVCFVLFFKLCF